jgi:peptidoglycan/LPS O-acetylase OafA/YrhL
LHPAVIFYFEHHFPAISNEWLRWAILCTFVLSVCYGFYLLIERPSHALARNVARRFRAAPPAPILASSPVVEDWKLKAEAQA